MGTNFICPRCGNKNPKYIGYKNGADYVEHVMEKIDNVPYSFFENEKKIIEEN